jgi:RND family efflux transporter MFP subunit
MGGLLALGLALFLHARSGTNQVTLASTPKLATVIAVKDATFRPSRTYVGTLQPWVMAKIGPQLVSAYVETVLVRPGAQVKRNQVIATLDCRNTSATNQALTSQARAVAATQAALAKAAVRVSGLLDGGFVSANEVDQRTAESESTLARLGALNAEMIGSSLQVGDCVLRAPFDGEIAERTMDPGAFVRPGTAIATEVDRGSIIVTADVPENDFEFVAPGTPVKLHLLATGEKVEALISRRAPSASESTRTVHLEIDLPNPDHHYPVGTTAEIVLDVGHAAPASEIPLSAATVRGSKASVFVVRDGKAHAMTVPMLGERDGALFVDVALAPKSQVVTEGRGALNDGDLVDVKLKAVTTTADAAVPVSAERAQ